MKLAIITGGSHGIGESLCDLYVRAGWAVIEFSRSAPHSYSTHVDLADARHADRVFRSTFAQVEVSDLTELVVVSNAAVLGPVGPVEQATVDQLMGHLEVNVASAMVFWRAVVDGFQETACPKTFVSVSSGAAVKGYAGWSLYCASKAALENFVRSVALEQSDRRFPIRAISVNPGVTDTAMQRQVRESSIEDFPSVERFVRLHDDDLLADPADVARQIADIVETRPEPGGVYDVRHE